MVDHAAAAQKAAEERIEELSEWLYEESEEGREEPEMLAPYDGCLTCEVREILHAAYPHLRAMWEEEEEGE